MSMITKGATLCHKAPDFSLQKENSDHLNAMEDENPAFNSDNTMERLPSTISEPAAGQVQRQEHIHNNAADPSHWEHQHHHHDHHDHHAGSSSRGASPEPYLVPMMYYAPMSPYYPHSHHLHHNHNGGSPPPPPPPSSYMMYGSSPPAMPYYPMPYHPPPHHHHHHQYAPHHHYNQQQQQHYLPPTRTSGSSPPLPPTQCLRSNNSAGDMMMTTTTTTTMMAETVYGGSEDNSSSSSSPSGGQLLLGKPKDRASARIARSQRAGGQYNPDQFIFNMEEALSGSPTARTTVMLKNIPNKYNQAQLMTMVEEGGGGGFKGAIDFLYLPVDFRTRCNLGYSFINFIDAAATARFYQHFHGKKWEEDTGGGGGGGRHVNGNNNNNGDALSKKVAQVAYGRVQGKDALVSHFKDAKFPNDDEQWMPVVFEMDGERGES